MKDTNRNSIESDLNRHHVHYEDPLWDEEKERTSNLINVSLLRQKDAQKIKSTQWRFFSCGEHVFTLSGQTLTKKQIHFLLTVDGMKFLVEAYKKGCINTNRLKTELKKLPL